MCEVAALAYTIAINMINIIPLGVTSRFHDFHHSDVEVNYGSNFCFWDAVFGTDISFRKHYDKLEDAKKEKKGNASELLHKSSSSSK